MLFAFCSFSYHILIYSYSTTGALSTEEGDDVNDEQFLETMRNLQDLAMNSKHPNSSSEKRRMSESAVNYTNVSFSLLVRINFQRLVRTGWLDLTVHF